jgi:hypothetical protein
MKKKASSLFLLFVCLLLVRMAYADVIVSNLANGVQVSSPFSLQANASTCGQQATASMGYSFDDRTDTTIIYAVAIDQLVMAPSPGAHTLHVKCWGRQGAAGVTDIQITATGGPSIPANATVVNNIQQLTSWAGNYDPGTPGGAWGFTTLVNKPSISGQARQFSMSYQNYGGQLFYTSFGIDTSATHFVYDAQLYISGSAAGIANLEMDLNQVTANGQTIIYGFQCDGYKGVWDYTINAGSPTGYIDTWVNSGTPCPPPGTWSVNTWHHVQIVYHRDTLGNVRYDSVWLDGVQYPLNFAVGKSAFSLGWGSTLLTNFQIDGLGSSGSATVYLDNLTVYRW